MKYLILSLVVLSIVLSGCTRPIGGERDEHGCLGPAGYSWNQNISACIREWELDENQKLAAKLAVDDLGYEYATTIIEVEIAGCPGCFVVNLEQGVNRDKIMVTISNWTIVEKTITRHTCTQKEKQAEICTLEYLPVCGFYSNGTSRTYGNGCGACVSGVEYWEYGECEEINKVCTTDEDCVVFGETGDCNCGCYNKNNVPSDTGGECFCQAPTSCECIDGKCEEIFE